jgi:hypothetical protein
MGKLINLGTDEEPEYDDIDGFIHNEINVNVNNALDIHGKLKDNIIKSISGSFSFKNLGNKQGILNLKMNNPITEYVVGKILEGDLTPFNNIHDLGSFANIHNYRNLPFFERIKEEYHDNLKYLNTEITHRHRNKVIEIKNPNTGKRIQVNKKAYKKLYKGIILKQIEYKQLSKYNQLEYEIINNCAVDFLNSIGISLDDIQKSLNRIVNNNLTYEDIMIILKDQNIGCKFMSPVGEIDNNNLPIKYTFMIYNDHLYVLDSIDKKKQLTKIITKLNQIDKYKNNKLIVENYDLFKEIKKHIKTNYILFEYSDFTIYYKSNIIIFSPSYTTDKQILKNINCRSVYKYINQKLNLVGYMSNDSFRIFQNCNKIRNYKTSIINNYQFDMNIAYGSQIIKIIKFPIPNINDRWTKFNKLVEHGFYYCELTSYDKILGCQNDIYFYDAVIILQKENRIKNIISEFVTEKYILLTEKQINFIKTLSHDLIRRFIGWLQKSLSVNTIKYDNVSKNDSKIILEYYGNESHKYNKNIRIDQIYSRKNTGLLANIIIKEMTNISLYNFNKEFIKRNPKAILNSIKTDSLGYICDNPKILFELMGTKIGEFKCEVPSHKNLKDYEYKSIVIYPNINNIKINEINKDNINQLLQNNESFLIDGLYGTGKTIYYIPKIISELDKLNKTYIKACLTTTASNRIKGVTLASIFNKKSDYEIITHFKDINYLIIDERTQLDQKMYKYLEFIKLNTNTKIILVGDDKQLKSHDMQLSYKNSNFIVNLVNGNIIDLKEKTHRCDEILSKHLDNINKINNIYEVKKYINENFKIVGNSNTNLNLSFYNTTCAKIINSGKKCETIILNQGDTINESYTIHDLKFINDVDILITALSRSTKYEYIFISK